MNNPYKPISCSLYDQLEAYAVKKTLLEIKYIEDGAEKTIQDYIINFKTLNKEEFLILSCGEEIRLDKVLTIKEN